MTRDHSDPKPDEPIEILLVEDNPGDVRLLQEAVEQIDREVSLRVRTDGDEAVEALVRRDDDASLPDIVLLDLNLPGRDGEAVLEAIRGDAALEALPVLMLTSSTSPDDVTRCYDAKANAYLEKPTDPAEFGSLMKSVEQFWVETARLPSVSA